MAPITLQQHCEVFQIPGLDYTEPAFQIAVAASDSLSQVRFFLDVGTTPGGSDVLHEEKLGGALTKVSKVFASLYVVSRSHMSSMLRSVKQTTCEHISQTVLYFLHGKI